jgi:hypothetical protein
MNTKVISDPSLTMINQYRNFHIDSAICSVPYYNNKVAGRRAALRVEVGKGSPKDIYEELMHIFLKNKVDIKLLTSEDLKKIMVENNIGIDCSGFAYYVLNEESLGRGKGSLSRHLHYDSFLAKFRPINNTNVLTYSDNRNSKIIPIKDAQVGDIITMVGGTEGGERNHILILSQIEYQNFIPLVLYYVHAIAWPSDGEYGHGIHEGKIEITNLEKGIAEQRWIELEKEGEENYTHMRANKSTTELRRLNWF